MHRRVLVIVLALLFHHSAFASGVEEYRRVRAVLQTARASATLRAAAARLLADARRAPALRLYTSGYAALLAYDRSTAERDLAASFRLSGSSAAAIALAENAVEVGDPAPVMDWTTHGLEASDRDWQAEIELRVMRAQALAWLTRHDEERVEATRAVELARTAGDSRLLARALRAYAYAIGYETNEALATYSEAIGLSETAGDSAAVGYHLLMMSGSYYPAHPFAEKITLFDRALTLARAVHDRQLEGRVLGARGLAWSNLARYGAALRDLTAADAVLHVTGAVRSRAVAAGNIGELFTALGDYERAEQQVRLSIALYRRVGNRYGIRNCLDDLSGIALLQGRASAAVKGHVQVVALTREFGDTEYLRGALLGLGLSNLAAHDWAAAERAIREALSITGDPKEPDTAGETRVALGHLLRLTDRPEEAERAYADALEMAPHLASATTLAVRAHHGLALLGTATGRPAEALAHYRAAIAGIEHIRGDVEQPSWRLTYFADKSALYVDAIDALVTEYQRTGDAALTREAFAFAESAKARNLLEEVRARGNTLPSIDQMASALEPTDRLVEYVAGDRRSFVFTLAPDGKITVRSLPGRAVLDPQIRALRDLVADRPSDANAIAAVQLAGSRLYQELLAEPLADSADVKRLIIVADGLLLYAPFEALTIENSRAYLAERFEIVRAASGSVLSAIRGRTTQVAAETPFVGFGDPSVTGQHRTAAAAVVRPLERDGFSFAPLPGSRREVEAAAAQFGSAARVFLGPSFTADAVTTELQRPHRVVHFATHAILDERIPDRSGIVVSASGAAPVLLRARDIGELHVPADLVALSACQTGLGQIVAGEGVLGLAWAFTRAGAASLMVTLWNVSDAASSTMMTAFYRALAAGLSKSAALQTARLEMLHNPNSALRHPYYWAGYVLIGDPGRSNK